MIALRIKKNKISRLYVRQVGSNLPMIPVDSVAKTLMFSLQVKTIEIGVVAGAVPPGSLKPLGTILAPSVVISVHCAELGPFLRQTLTKLTIDVCINDPEPKMIFHWPYSYDKVASSHMDRVFLVTDL